MAWPEMLLCIFFTIWTRTTVANYDKTIRMHLVRGYLANVNDMGVSIEDRSFLHFNMHTCSGIYLSLQSTWNVTLGKHLIVELRPEAALLYDCSEQPEPACVTRPTEVEEMKIFRCNMTFLLKVSWTEEGVFEFSRGESLNDESRHLISCGGGPNVEKLFTYQTKEKMKMLYLAFGPLGSGQMYVNVTYSNKVPHNETKSLSLLLPESQRPHSRVHRLREFHYKEVIKMVNVTPDPASLTIKEGYLIQTRPLDYEAKRTHVIDMILKGDVLTLKLRVVLRVIDVVEHEPNITQTREIVMVEELPVGTILMPYVKVINVEAGDKVMYKLMNNSYFSMDESTGTLTLLKRVDRDAPGNVRKIPVVMKIANRVASRTIGFNITVVDSNDNQPTFQKSLHRIEMPFSTNATSNIVTRFVLSDVDLNDSLLLRIQDGDQSLFYLNNTLLCVHLDKLMTVETLRDKDWSFTVTVAVLDTPHHGPSRLSFSTVILIVQPPEDLETYLQAEDLAPLHLPEDAAIGLVVLRLQDVIKLPSLYNDGYQFSLHSGESVCENGKRGSDYFGIDQYNGNVMVGDNLDADIQTQGCTEMALTFNITNVLSGDSNIVANINITITDVNDNPPIFQENRIDILMPCHLQNETASIKRNDHNSKKYFTKEIPIQVSDVDSEVHLNMELFPWDRFVYRLTRTNAMLWVLVASVDTHLKLDKDDVDVVMLLAIDEGVTSLTSTALVLIRQECTSSSPSGQADGSQELFSMNGRAGLVSSQGYQTTTVDQNPLWFTKADRRPISTKTRTTYNVLGEDKTKMSENNQRPVTICTTYKVTSTTKQSTVISTNQPSHPSTPQSSMNTSESTPLPCCPCKVNNKTSRNPGEWLKVKYTLIAFCSIFALVLLGVLAWCTRRKMKENQIFLQSNSLEATDQERSST